MLEIMWKKKATKEISDIYIYEGIEEQKLKSLAKI